MPELQSSRMLSGVLQSASPVTLSGALQPATTHAEDYNTLANKPRVNGVQLSGDVSLEALGAAEADTLSKLYTPGSDNLINPDKLIKSRWINNSTGVEFFDGVSDVITDYIYLDNTPGQYGIISAFRAWFYDATKSYIGTVTFDLSGTVLSVAANVKYIRLGTGVTSAPNLTMIKGNTIPEYTPYRSPSLYPSAMYGTPYSDKMPNVKFAFGGLFSTGKLSDSRDGIRFAEPVAMKAGSTIFCSGQGMRQNVMLFSFDGTNYTPDTSTYWITTTNQTYTLANDAYVMMSIWKADDSDFDSLTEASVINIGMVTTLEEKLDDLSESVDSLGGVLGLPYNKEEYTYFAPIPYEYYAGLQADYTTEGFSKNTSFADIISAFDGLVSQYPNYITKTDLGVSSDGTNHIYSYETTPLSASRDGRELPTMLIVSGQHGYEKVSIFGLYYFLKDLCEKWYENSTLDALRNHVIIKMIPAANPYGLNNNSYYNANNINLNKNYPTSAFPVDSEGGTTAFSEPETQYIRDFVLANPHAVVLVDFHSNGADKPTLWADVNWIDFPVVRGDFRLSFVGLAYAHLENITAHFVKEYNLAYAGLVGRVTNPDSGYPEGWPSLDTWANMQGIVGMTVEGSGGFPSDANSYTASSYRYNSEIIGNWLGFVYSMLSMKNI